MVTEGAGAVYANTMNIRNDLALIALVALVASCFPEPEPRGADMASLELPDVGQGEDAEALACGGVGCDDDDPCTVDACVPETARCVAATPRAFVFDELLGMAVRGQVNRGTSVRGLGAFAGRFRGSGNDAGSIFLVAPHGVAYPFV